MISFAPRKRRSRLTGLIPAGWFPGALAYDAARKTVLVANIKGHAVETTPYKPTGAPGFNSHQYHGSVSIVPVPGKKELKRLSAVVADGFRRERIALALEKPRPGQPARPVPERIGEPSVFKHVVYVIKENRTYDQILGDVAAGNGDPALTIFGEKVTPNQHKLVREFVLLDNTYCSGILSADGHQWSTTAFGTDYLERSFAGWPRSYPDGMGPDDDRRPGLRAERVHLGQRPGPRRLTLELRRVHHAELRLEGPQPARASRSGRTTGTSTSTAAARSGSGAVPAIPTVAPFSPDGHPGLEHGGPRRLAGPLHRQPDRRVGEGGAHAPAHPRLPARRPHQRHERGLADPGSLRRRQRPGLRPHRRGLQPQRLLEGDRDLRHRGRPPERLGPRQRLPDHGLLREPVHEARRRRLDPVQHDEPPRGRSSRSSACRR
ncbi:MAG: hypothetical protein M0C28_20060 [Candidatus Moduliflexus flocculans]|nr:hypothetical protein [Candidatus Moduliflexus flocculans]